MADEQVVNDGDSIVPIFYTQVPRLRRAFRKLNGVIELRIPSAECRAFRPSLANSVECFPSIQRDPCHD